MLLLVITAIGVLLAWIKVTWRIITIIIVVGALVLLLGWTVLLLILWWVLLVVGTEGLLVRIVILAIIILLAWLLIRVLLLLLIWLAIGIVILVIITVLVITVIVLLVSIIAIIVVTWLVVLGILWLEVAVLIVVIGALIIGTIVIILMTLWRISIALLSVGRLKVIFYSACKAFKAFRDIGTTMRARDAAMGIFIIFASPKKCFAVAELDSGVGIELKPSAEKGRFCASDQFAKCGTFSNEFVVFWIGGEIAFKLIGKRADFIVSEFFGLFASEAFKIVFGE